MEHNYSNGKTHMYVWEAELWNKRHKLRLWGHFHPHPPKSLDLPPSAKENNKTKYKNASIWGAAPVPKT